MNDLPLLMFTGAIAGTLAGLLGIGGGVIIVPVLVFVFQHQGINPDVIMHTAIGTSLATIAITSIASIRAHHAHGAVLWTVVKQMTPAVLVGGLLGAAIADQLPSETLKKLFAPFMVVIAIQMLMGRSAKPHRDLPKPLGMAAAGGIVGAISALFGIGGGSLNVPFLTWCNVQVKKAVATSAAIGFPIALAGGLGFIVSGWSMVGRPEWSVGYINLPASLGIVLASAVAAPYGARLAHRVPDVMLRRVFAGLLVILAAKLYFG